jgi:TonB family protein
MIEINCLRFEFARTRLAQPYRQTATGVPTMSTGKALTIQVLVIVCAMFLHLPVSAQDAQSDAPQSLALPKLKKLPSNAIYYPDDAKRMGAQGRVLLEFGIDDKGHPTQVVIQKSDGDKMLAKSAVKILNGLVFDLSTVPDSEGRAGHQYRLSFVFELTPCGKLQHFDVPKDCEISVCGTPIRPR